MSSVVQLSGGNFQDSEGNVLNEGYLLFELSQDAQANSTDQICAGRVIKILLDNSGNVQSSPAQSIWPNDALTPAGTFYIVRGYTAQGELVWGPNAQQVFSTPSPYNLNSWVPNYISNLNGSTPTYDIGIFLQGSYTANQLVVLLKLERQVRFQANFLPSTATIGTNPTSIITFPINQNGVQIGSLAINTSGVATFSTNSSSGVLFNTGDILEIVAPATTDATAANVGIILSGLITGG